MQKKTKRVFTTLSEVEYENLRRFLEGREQPVAEYVLMSLAVLMDDENAVVERKNRQKGVKQLLSVRCSDCVYSAVDDFAKKHNTSKAEVISTAIKEAIRG